MPQDLDGAILMLGIFIVIDVCVSYCTTCMHVFVIHNPIIG